MNSSQLMEWFIHGTVHLTANNEPKLPNENHQNNFTKQMPNVVTLFSSYSTRKQHILLPFQNSINRLGIRMPHCYLYGVRFLIFVGLHLTFPFKMRCLWPTKTAGASPYIKNDKGITVILLTHYFAPEATEKSRDASL